MKVTDLTAPVIEPVEDRYDRDWLDLNDDRKVRGFDYQAAERRERGYVDPDTGDTVSETGDNDPAGFDKAAFEDALVYNPNADGEDGEPGTGDGDGEGEGNGEGEGGEPGTGDGEGGEPGTGDPVEATSAIAGAPGTFAPEGAEAPADLAALGTVTADPTTAWTEGQYVVLGDASEAHWDGDAWVSGRAQSA